MRRRDRLLHSMLRHRYMVTTITEETFDGVLVDHDEQHLVLADVTQVALNGTRVAVDGQLWLPRPSVKYLQTINP